MLETSINNNQKELEAQKEKIYRLEPSLKNNHEIETVIEKISNIIESISQEKSTEINSDDLLKRFNELLSGLIACLSIEKAFDDKKEVIFNITILVIIITQMLIYSSMLYTSSLFVAKEEVNQESFVRKLYNAIYTVAEAISISEEIHERTKLKLSIRTDIFWTFIRILETKLSNIKNTIDSNIILSLEVKSKLKKYYKESSFLLGYIKQSKDGNKIFTEENILDREARINNMKKLMSSSQENLYLTPQEGNELKKIINFHRNQNTNK